MNLNQEQKQLITHCLNLLHNLEVDGFKIESLSLNNDCIIFSNDKTKNEVKISDVMKVENNNINTETDNNTIHPSDLDLTSSENPHQKNTNQEGGFIFKNIFQKSKYSDTSSINQTENNQFSSTSETFINESDNKQKGGFLSKDIFQKSKYSDTSSLNQTNITNLSATSTDMFNGRSDKYSDTSALDQVGGGLTSETLNISELKPRKTSKSSRTSTNLDMGIFTKKSQSGGSTNNIRKKMMEVGINSNSSTSSICE